MRVTTGMRFYPAIDPGSLRKCPRCREWLYALLHFEWFPDPDDLDGEPSSDIWCIGCADTQAEART